MDGLAGIRNLQEWLLALLYLFSNHFLEVLGDGNLFAVVYEALDLRVRVEDDPLHDVGPLVSPVRYY